MATSLKAAPVAAAVGTALLLGACAHNPTGYGSRLTERECLARVMYFESNRSSEDGMLAVGTVVMNRLQSSRYPKTVCGVVGQQNQFAEGALSKPVSGRSYVLALKVADAVMAGDRHSGVGAAMFFHTAGYTFPYRNMAYLVAAGGNVFYEKRTPGTFTPIHPATLVAQASPARARPAGRIQVAERDDEEEEAPRPRRRLRPEPPVRTVEEEPARTRRPAPVQVASADEAEDMPVVRSFRRETRPLSVATTSSARRDGGPPSIAELIALDLPQKRR